MVACGDDIGTGIDRLEKDIFGDAEAAGGVLAVDDDEVQHEVTDQPRKTLPDRRAARLANHISQKQKPHARSIPPEQFQEVLRPELRKTTKR